MRLLVIIFLVCLSSMLRAQQITGLVVDETTKKPIVNARVITPNSHTFTAVSGRFNLRNIHFGDTILVSHMGYESRSVIYGGGVKADTVLILLHVSPIAIQEVAVKGIRNYKRDSLNRRKEYASVFDAQATKFKDIFIPKSPNASGPYSPFQGSTSRILSVNLLSVFSFLAKNKSAVSKLQKKLLKEEEYNYVDQIFTHEKVRSMTPLKGDSLQNFMNKYRPEFEEARHMTDYQLLLHIKKSYLQFIESDRSEYHPSLNK